MVRSTASSPLETFDWTPLPEPAAFVHELIAEFLARSPRTRELAGKMRELTGTRLVDWIDHLGISAGSEHERRLAELGFVKQSDGEHVVWTHPRGMFPAVLMLGGRTDRRGLAIKAESVVDFLFAQGLEEVVIEGEPLAPLRRARAWAEDGAKLWVIERHGYRGFTPAGALPGLTDRVLHHTELFMRRRRRFATTEEGFEHARRLIRAAKEDVGVDRAADLFFAAERVYWMSRNRAAQVQKARQDRLGLGWANHDHHTYRSGRSHFAALVELMEELGLECRERFYTGAAAGWGAQVMEQRAAGVVVFADVDLSPEEVTDDFAHGQLAERDHLGTVGLWCALHGEAVLGAGMHHLECQFDFEIEREQLGEEGVGSMKPFTFFPHLKQAFTEPEVWAVDEGRIDGLLRRGQITMEQAQRFRREGAVGSHLEVLQRDEGYKGFNQTGISEVIRRTDPRG